MRSHSPSSSGKLRHSDTENFCLYAAWIGFLSLRDGTRSTSTISVCEGKHLQDAESGDLTGFQVEHNTLRTLLQPLPRLTNVESLSYLWTLLSPSTTTLDASHFGDDPHIDRILNALPHVPFLRIFDFRGLCITSDPNNILPFLSTPYCCRSWYGIRYPVPPRCP